jgi:ferredoxin
MIRSITKAKDPEELKRLLHWLTRLFVAGCGTCATLTQTGGVEEVESMRLWLMENGKIVTSTTVIPVACDQLSHEILEEHEKALKAADAILVMSCAYGVQTLATQTGKMVIPALDTVFVGKETAQGEFQEACEQCGDCILGDTGGICPVTACHKGLVNGPCGGTNHGKCEIDPDKDCAWTSIYLRLSELDKLDRMRRYQEPKNYNVEPKPGKIRLTSG